MITTTSWIRDSDLIVAFLILLGRGFNPKEKIVEIALMMKNGSFSKTKKKKKNKTILLFQLETEKEQKSVTNS